MLFHSLSYAVFLPVVFAVYWLLGRNLRAQNLVLLAASYYFYSCWDWRFLGLLLFSTLLDFGSGLMLGKTESPTARRAWLWLSIGVNLSFLGAFKYYNFFAASAASGLAKLGMPIQPVLIQVILPVGISFYTFHGLSYIIDVYKRRISPERNFVDYVVFVSFFPLLVAGPIERATHLLPQIKKPRRFDYEQATDGLRQILWGLFKKIVIADGCAQPVNEIFLNYSHYSGSTLVVGAVLFSIQIYGDFSGYTDIAIGSARLLGIDLLRNFAFPYFSRDIAEFWRRWHISLSGWFQDYVYIPLGGSRGSRWKTIRNVLIVFLLSGFWHGANWTFIAWGALHALYFLPLLLLVRNRRHMHTVASGRRFPTVLQLLQIGLTFGLTTFAWIFFRADTLTHAFHYVAGIANRSLFSLPQIRPRNLFVVIAIFMLAEWAGREGSYGLAWVKGSIFLPLRWAVYYVLVVCIYCQTTSGQPFIYFQF